eukprot:GHVS01079607.1.p1 GENE.GHVS01079607.1~~GHVS01079607.1.p1  ORF type:complete len:1225 (+),score=178.47 GHVS01079607.1:90-3677(+)
MALSLTVVIFSVGLMKVLVKRKSEYQVKQMTEVKSRITVLRNLQWIRISSENIVPGDVIALEEKTPVCCDCVLVDGRCVIDESSLTGEPTPVPKIPLSASAADKPYNKHAQADLKYTLLAGTFIESTSPGTMKSSHVPRPRTTSYPTQPPPKTMLLGDGGGGEGLRKTRSTVTPAALTGQAERRSDQKKKTTAAVVSADDDVAAGKLRWCTEPARTRAVVLSTGVQTDQGQLIRGILFPSPLHFKFDQHWKLVFLGLLIYGLFLYVGVEAIYNFEPIGFFYGIFTISQIMSPLIPAVFVAGQAKASSRLKKKDIFCVNLQRIFVAGKLSIFCFDKTGTLTKSGLEYYGVRVFRDDQQGDELHAPLESDWCGGGAWSDKTLENSFENQIIGDFLGCCHELDVVACRTDDESNVDSSADGNGRLLTKCFRWLVAGVSRMLSCWCGRRSHQGQMEVASSDASFTGIGKDGDTTTTTNGSGPTRVGGANSRDGEPEDATEEFEIVGNEVDKQMFVSSAFRIDIGQASSPVVKHLHSGRELKILRRFEFDRSTMTMSVVVEEVTSSHSGLPPRRFVFCKGSYEGVAHVANGRPLPDDFEETTTGLAKNGFYVLGMAFKMYEGPVDCELPRTEIESGLQMLGLLLFRNDLKPDSQQVISELREGGIRPVMITGDNALTANKIGKQVGLVLSQRVLLGDVVKGVPPVEATLASAGAAAGTRPKGEEGGGGEAKNSAAQTCDPMPVDVTLSARVEWKDVDTGEVMQPAECFHSLKSGALELAVSGPAFDLLREQPVPAEWSACGYATDAAATSYMASLLPYTSVFARMKPDQKINAVRLHMEFGITGMCGDGANDAGALRASHCGIALSSGSTEATVVAPFSTSHESLKAVPIMIAEGRNALATAMAGYKRLILQGQSLLALKMASYYFTVVAPQAWWITTDCFINIGMAWALLQSRPAPKLSPSRPTSKLIGTETCASIAIQVLINWLFVLIVLVVLFNQPWFDCKAFDPRQADTAKWWTMGDNYENLVLSTLGLFQFINAVAAYNFGFDYRVSWLRNYWPLLFWCAFMSFATALVFSGPSFLSCTYRYNCGDQSLLTWWTDNIDPPRLRYHGEDIDAPPGCPCSDQITFSDTCESEYTQCTNSRYNQSYHHNIMPTSFRGIMFAIIVINCILNVVVEGFFITGPFRRYLRRRKKAKALRNE